MTKVEFFRRCSSAQQTTKYPLQVVINSVPRESEHAVYLHGYWCNGAFSSVMLYRPTPGRQWQMRDKQPWEPACEKAKAKFERWLQEWHHVK